ncbi:uncharacterized protein [Salvelinus alpinus]|uniref:uncharacterized protein n=1 Tax=Salvelinus alpinus TaxID=8036 RepID=UPI0039FDB834
MSRHRNARGCNYDEGKLFSRLNQMREVLGDTVPESVLTQVALQCAFDPERALETILSDESTGAPPRSAKTHQDAPLPQGANKEGPLPQGANKEGPLPQRANKEMAAAPRSNQEASATPPPKKGACLSNSDTVLTPAIRPSADPLNLSDLRARPVKGRCHDTHNLSTSTLNFAAGSARPSATVAEAGSSSSLAQLMSEHDQKSQRAGLPSLSSSPLAALSGLSLGTLALLNSNSAPMATSPPGHLASSLGSLSLGNPKLTAPGANMASPSFGSLSSVLQSSRPMEIGSGGGAKGADPKGSPSLAELIQEHSNSSPTLYRTLPGLHGNSSIPIAHGNTTQTAAGPAAALTRSLSQLQQSPGRLNTRSLSQLQQSPGRLNTRSLSQLQQSPGRLNTRSLSQLQQSPGRLNTRSLSQLQQSPGRLNTRSLSQLQQSPGRLNTRSLSQLQQSPGRLNTRSLSQLQQSPGRLNTRSLSQLQQSPGRLNTRSLSQLQQSPGRLNTRSLSQLQQSPGRLNTRSLSQLQQSPGRLNTRSLSQLQQSPGRLNTRSLSQLQQSPGRLNTRSLSQLQQSPGRLNTHCFPQTQITTTPEPHVLSLSLLASRRQPVSTVPAADPDGQQAEVEPPPVRLGKLSQLASQHHTRTSSETPPSLSLAALLSPGKPQPRSIQEGGVRDKPRPLLSHTPLSLHPPRGDQSVDLSVLMAQSSHGGALFARRHDKGLSSPSAVAVRSDHHRQRSSVFARPSVFALTLSVRAPSRGKRRRMMMMKAVGDLRLEVSGGGHPAFLYGTQTQLVKAKEQMPLLPITPFTFDTPSPDDVVRANQKKAFTRE